MEQKVRVRILTEIIQAESLPPDSASPGASETPFSGTEKERICLEAEGIRRDAGRMTEIRFSEPDDGETPPPAEPSPAHAENSQVSQPAEGPLPPAEASAPHVSMHTTSLLFRGDEIRVRRSGTVSADLRFAAGVRTLCPYQTPWGQMTFTAATDLLSFLVEAQTVTAEIRYRLFSGENLIGRYRVQILAQKFEK